MSRRIHGMGVEERGRKAERERRRAQQQRHMEAEVVRGGLRPALLCCLACCLPCSAPPTHVQLCYALPCS